MEKMTTTKMILSNNEHPYKTSIKYIQKRNITCLTYNTIHLVRYNPSPRRKPTAAE